MLVLSNKHKAVAMRIQWMKKKKSTNSNDSARRLLQKVSLMTNTVNKKISKKWILDSNWTSTPAPQIASLVMVASKADPFFKTVTWWRQWQRLRWSRRPWSWPCSGSRTCKRTGGRTGNGPKVLGRAPLLRLSWVSTPRDISSTSKASTKIYPNLTKPNQRIWS